MLSSPLANHFVRSPPFFPNLHPYPFSHFMGNPTVRTLAAYARAVAARTHNPRKNPPSKPKPVNSLPSQPASGSSAGVRGRRMESRIAREKRVPLSVVVSDCVKGWFEDALEQALEGDTSMAILVAQMYHSGYGVAKDERQAKEWIKEASKYRSSAKKDGYKRPVACQFNPDYN